MSNTLRGIISQRLIPDVTGKGRVPAVEVMINTSTVQEYIREPDKTHMIADAIADGYITYQMQTFDQSLMALFKEGRISLEEALRACTNPHEFSLRIKGIHSTSNTTWDNFEADDKEQEKSGRPPKGEKGDFVKL